MRPLALPAERFDCADLLSEWRWRIPDGHEPLLIGAFGDWIFGAPDGSIYNLSLLEGDYRRIADDGDAFNALKQDPERLNDWFLAEWVGIARGRGLEPAEDQCLGWTVHPLLGAPLAADNLQLFAMRVYQSLMGQLFRQLAAPPVDKGP